MQAVDSDHVAIVSGLPRSGTSMMMRMLDRGGLPVLTDRRRAADDDNPHGYYEFEAVKELPGNRAWLPQARGKAVKVIYKLVHELPPDEHYRLIFLRRSLREVIASQEAMLARSGQGPGDIAPGTLEAMFQAEIVAFTRWLEGQRNFEVLYVDHADVLAAPGREAERIAGFLGCALDIPAMAAAVDPSLHRQTHGA